MILQDFYLILQDLLQNPVKSHQNPIKDMGGGLSVTGGFLKMLQGPSSLGDDAQLRFQLVFTSTPSGDNLALKIGRTT